MLYEVITGKAQVKRSSGELVGYGKIGIEAVIALHRPHPVVRHLIIGSQNVKYFQADPHFAGSRPVFVVLDNYARKAQVDPSVRPQFVLHRWLVVDGAGVGQSRGKGCQSYNFV